MAQWGQQQQQQPGYQYPMQTGYNPQFQQQQPQQNPQFQQQQGFPGGGLAPQMTGYPGQQQLPPQTTGFPGHQQQTGFQNPQQTGFQQPQQTGYGASTFLQTQPTGYQGLQARSAPPIPPVPPVPPIPSRFQGQPGQQQPQQTGYLGLQPQNQQQQQQPPNRFLSTSPAMGGPSLQAQPTGMGVARPLVPQATGYVDPRLQMMGSTFLPVNPSSPYGAGGAPQLPSQQIQGGLSMQQGFQQYNQQNIGSTQAKLQWAISKPEKKKYDQIFRAWDNGTGFITGQTGLEVFGQSGLSKDDLARIWSLADVNDRGKLNVAEFHVAMGLIYRNLNGMPIPDVLPPELVPPSARDLDASVDFLKDVLKNDSTTRSPSNGDSSYSTIKNRSLYTNSEGAGSRDASNYRHNDSEPPGGFYQPRSRHVDRNNIRGRNEEDSPAADLSDMKRQLENSARMLDRSMEQDSARSAEDEELEREMSELRVRVRRVQEDLDYVSRGPRSASKDDERRKLERELMRLMHERLPEVEKRIQERDAKKDREKREWARARDRRNDRFGRYDDKDSRDTYSSRYIDRDRERDRPYSRNAYDRDDRDRPYSRNSYDRDDRERDRDYRRDRSHERDRPRSPVGTAARTPPPAPPAAAPSLQAPPPPAPSASPAPSIKNMTPEERKAFARAEAQRRVDARMAALGVTSPSSSTPTIDTSVEDRLAQDKKEAEEKARAAEKAEEERAKARKEKLENERALKEGRATPASPAAAAPPDPAPPAPTPTLKAAPPAPTPRAAPPAPKPRVPPPAPAPRAVRVPAPPAPAAPGPAPTPPAPPAEPEVDPEEEAILARQKALRKQREARAERLKQLEAEEAEAQRAEEEYQARRQAFLNTPKSSAPTTPVVAPEPPAFAAPPPAPSPPPAPPAPPAPPPSQEAAASPAAKSKTNPFSQMMKDGGSAPPAATSPAVTPAANGSSNPFFRSQTATAPPPSAPTPTKSPGPTATKASYNTAPRDSDNEDWGDVNEKDEDDSSDDDVPPRDVRTQIANQLFGGMVPRPQSTPAGAASTPPPPAPAAPPAPRAPSSAPAVSAEPPNVSALMTSIRGGARLRKAVTVDKSGPQLAGSVIGGSAPPEHINAAPRPPSPPSPVAPAAVLSPPPSVSPAAEPQYDANPPSFTNEDSASHQSHRQSVGWFAGLAADQQGGPGAVPAAGPTIYMPQTIEEDEDVESPVTPVPGISVTQADDDAGDDLMADIDLTTTIRVRSLYPYEGQRNEDLSFGENLIIVAHPSKSNGDWWHGETAKDHQSGFFPRTYVQPLENVIAKALYDYAGNNPDELPFVANDVLTIIDKTSEADWWKTEKDGVVFIVPAAYLEVVEDYSQTHKVDASLGSSPNITSPAVSIPRLQIAPSSPANFVSSANNLQVDATDALLSPDEDSDSGSDWGASDTDSDNEADKPKDRAAREHERRLVLEAAGLILNQDVKPPAHILERRKSKQPKHRRPAPAAPLHRRQNSSSSVIPGEDSVASPRDTRVKDLPPVPEPEPELDSSTHLHDAFERYEAFKNTMMKPGHDPRLSVSSMDQMMRPPSPISPSTSTGTRDSDTGKTYSQFLNFLGRNKTPVSGDSGERKMPIISGPIMNPESIERQNSPAFGSSWTSLVDKSALEGLPEEERKRQEAIFELITTEGLYVRDLQLIVEVFYSNLMSLLDQKAITVVFANIEDILLTSTAFFSSLEERQKECRLYVDQIGDILRTHMKNMGVYMEYCVNHATSIKVLQSLRDSDAGLASHLQRIRDSDPTVRNLDLSSYLLVPMQRITKYPLLIRQILQRTNAESERENVQSALDIAERLLNRINETIREQEGTERLKSISKNLWIGQGRLDLTAPTRYMGARRLIREGPLTKTKSRRKIRAFLMNDILVLTDEGANNLYRMPIPLAQVQLSDLSSGRDDTAFEISMSYPRGGDKLAVRATSVRDCQLWMEQILQASHKCKEYENRAMRRNKTR